MYLHVFMCMYVYKQHRITSNNTNWGSLTSIIMCIVVHIILLALVGRRRINSPAYVRACVTFFYVLTLFFYLHRCRTCHFSPGLYGLGKMTDGSSNSRISIRIRRSYTRFSEFNFCLSTTTVDSTIPEKSFLFGNASFRHLTKEKYRTNASASDKREW